MSNTMSERLKETLGMMDSSVEIENVRTIDDEEFVGSRGTELAPYAPKQVPTTVSNAIVSDIRDDYVTSRNITHSLIGMAGSALEGALNVAVETQHPKAYAVFNELATTMRGLSKDLLEMQKIYKEISADKEKEAAAAARAQSKSQRVTQNNVNIVQTTNTSLADVLKQLKENDKNGVDMAHTIDEEDIIDV